MIDPGDIILGKETSLSAAEMQALDYRKDGVNAYILLHEGAFYLILKASDVRKPVP